MNGRFLIESVVFSSGRFKLRAQTFREGNKNKGGNNKQRVMGFYRHGLKTEEWMEAGKERGRFLKNKHVKNGGGRTCASFPFD